MAKTVAKEVKKAEEKEDKEEKAEKKKVSRLRTPVTGHHTNDLAPQAQPSVA